MITRIEAHNYRCFPALSVDLGRYHVLAGANGAGKTTLLDIPMFVGELIRRRGIVATLLDQQDNGRAPRASTLTDLLHKGQGDAVAFAFEARLPSSVAAVLGETSQARVGGTVPTHLRYELRLAITAREIGIADEYLFLFAEDGDRPAAGTFPQGRSVVGLELQHDGWQSVIHRPGGPLTQFTPETTRQPTDIPQLRLASTQLALGAVPPDETFFPASLWFAGLLRDAVYFAPDPEALRGAAPPGLPKRLTPSGRSLPWLALGLENSRPADFSSWIDHVRTALPQIKDIRAHEREGDHYAYFSVEYEGGYQVTSPGLSDGTLKIMAVTLLPFLGAEVVPRLLVTEEPENGIHPRAIETVIESLSSLFDVQVWVSTHSPIVLAHTERHDILATRLTEDGSVSVVPGDLHPRLREWQGEVDLGTLFAAGVLS